MSTLLIRNATILTMDSAIGELFGGDLLIRDATIAEVGINLVSPPGGTTIDGHGYIVIPGFVDTHQHMYQAVLRGMAPHHNLGDYFGDVLGTVVPHLKPHDLWVGERLSAQAALAAGVTTVHDISNVQSSPAHTDAIVDALSSSRIRAVLGYGLPLTEVARQSRIDEHEANRVRGLLNGELLSMSLVTESSSDATEIAHARLADDLDLRSARHVSREYPISRLAQLQALREGTVYIHANGLSDRDFQYIADSGGSVSVAAGIEMTMGHGYPVLSQLPLSVLATLSTDVEVTMPADMFTQMRAAYASSRTDELVLGNNPPRTVTVKDVLRAATTDGAASLGLGDVTGSLTPGKYADLVILRANTPDTTPVIDPYSTVVLQMDRSHIDTVMVAGRIADAEDNADTVTAAMEIVDRLRGVGVLARQ